MIVNLLKRNIEDKYAIYANLDENEQLLNALEWNWINGNKPMSTPYWADKVGMANLDNFIFALSKANWIVSKANAYRKWGEFYLDQRKIDSLLTEEQQKRYRTKIRQKHYAMRNVENNATDLVKTPKGYIQTGLVREGFAKCANQPFKLDTTPLAKYYDAVVANLTKSMDKVMQKYPTISLDETNYRTISIELLDYYIFNHDKTYNLEGNVSDSRGRAIYNALSRVGNPIASKDIRACLVVPTPKYISKTDSKSLKDIYLFIAELVGNKSKSWNAKALAGMVAYGSRALHELDLTKAEDRKHLHENIWLERMYHALDIINAEGGILWDIPIEIDATMSLAQIIGVLTNDRRLLDRTNVINSSNLLDAWHVEGVPRLHTKTVGTPVFYGSAQTATKLLRAKKLEYTKEHVQILNREFNKGAFGVIKGFKDFLIQHSNVDTPIINMHIWDDEFQVHVNKFKPVSAQVKAYKVWDSEKNRSVVFLNHEPIRVPDYDRFRLYYPTGLVHNLDSQVMNKVLLRLDEWAIAIHDAILVLPGTNARALYVEVLEELRANRKAILSNYFKAIGATSNSARIAWAKLMDKVEQLDSSVPFEESALK